MGLKVITDGKAVTVYRKDRTSSAGLTYSTYSLGVSSKNQEGAWVNGFVDCQFKKGVSVPHKAKINITNSFYTVREYNDKKYVSLFVLDYEIVSTENAVAQNPPAGDQEWMNIPGGFGGDELPFK